MRKLVVAVSAVFCLFTVAAGASAQTANLTATVRVNPLEVKISPTGAVPAREWIDIPVVVSNLGSETITKTVATFYGSPKLSVKGSKKRIGNLAPGGKTITWRVKANRPEDFVIQVEVTGELAGDEVSASDSIIISATDFLGFSLLKLIFGELD